VIEPEEASDALGFALSDDRGGWVVLRDEQREHLAAKALVKREVTADGDNLVVGMGGHDQYTLFLDRTELDRHTVGDAVDAAEETRRRALKNAVEEWGSLHFGPSPVNSTYGALQVQRPP
jgi:hypothetical protein